MLASVVFTVVMAREELAGADIELEGAICDEGCGLVLRVGSVVPLVELKQA